MRPDRRRHGLLAERWHQFLATFGDFWNEHPLSNDMKAFVARYAFQEQLRRIGARYPNGSRINNPKEKST